MVRSWLKVSIQITKNFGKKKYLSNFLWILAFINNLSTNENFKNKKVLFCTVSCKHSLFKTLYVPEFKVYHKVSYFNTLCGDKVFFFKKLLWKLMIFCLIFIRKKLFFHSVVWIFTIQVLYIKKKLHNSYIIFKFLSL